MDVFFATLTFNYYNKNQQISLLNAMRQALSFVYLLCDGFMQTLSISRLKKYSAQSFL